VREAAGDFTENAERIVPRLVALGSWLGPAGRTVPQCAGRRDLSSRSAGLVSDRLEETRDEAAQRRDFAGAELDGPAQRRRDDAEPGHLLRGVSRALRLLETASSRYWTSALGQGWFLLLQICGFSHSDWSLSLDFPIYLT
jgi:hypothetical protein